MLLLAPLLAFAASLLSPVRAGFESFRYVNPNETVELLSSPFFQTFAARGINTFTTQANCPEVMPALLQPDAEFTNNDVLAQNTRQSIVEKCVLSIYSMEFAPDDSALGGYFTFLFQDYSNHISLRYFYNTVSNFTDVNITVNPGFDFCSSVYNSDTPFVVQVLCVNSSTDPKNDSQTLWNYTVSLRAKSLVANNSLTVQNTNFLRRLTSLHFVYNSQIVEIIYEPYSQVFQSPSTHCECRQ